MPLSAFLLALGAAFVHALWNLLIARARDPEAAAAVALLTAVVVFAPVVALRWELEPEAWPYVAASSALEPGDAVFFHMLTLHAAGGVSLGNRRRAFSVRFLGDDATHAPRPWKTSPDFPGLADELPAGAPMDHPLFPVLWERGPVGA